MMHPLLFALGAAASLAAAPPALPPLVAGPQVKTLPLSAVSRGQHGVCYTVFEGDTVEPFAFVVKDVMPNFLGPQADLLLVRLEGEKPEFTGVVAGMSGSPCLIDGQLVGALSYAFAAFAKEPIAGITPIAAMRATNTLSQQARPYRLMASRAQAAWPIAPPAWASSWTPVVGDGSTSDVPQEDMGITPILTPLGLGNMHPAVRETFTPYLRAMGFAPMVTGGAGGQNKASHKEGLEPGGAIAVVMVSGDMDMAATGTVTWLDGNRVMAFGHPFMGAGAVSFPMAQSHIVNTMVSSQRSFKMAVAGQVVGEIDQDRLPAISGTLGAAPKMVPIHGILQTADGNSTFELNVARDPEMTPRLVAMSVANALTSRVAASTHGTGTLTATFHIADRAPVEVTWVQAEEKEGVIFMQPAMKLYQHMAALWDTTFGAVGPLRIDIVAKLQNTPIEETITDVVFDRATARVGETVQVAVRMRQLGGVQTVSQFALPIPARWAGQNIDIVAASASRAQGLLEEVQGPLRPQNYDDILAHMRAQPQGHQLNLYAVRAGTGHHHGVSHFAFVPPTALVQMGQGVSDTITQQGIDFATHRDRPGVVRGRAQRTLHIDVSSHLDRRSRSATK